MRRSWLLSIVCSAVCCLLLDPATAQESAHPVPKAGEFPPPNTGTYLAGELVIIDPVNRRGGLRLDGNEPHDRYHSGPLHYFAMLPYGMLSFNGAPAELHRVRQRPCAGDRPVAEIGAGLAVQHVAQGNDEIH